MSRAAELIAAIERDLAALKALVLDGEIVTPKAPAASLDLDSKYGDPIVGKDPPRWKKGSYVGKRFSQCPPDYLESLAGFLEWKAGKTIEEGDPNRLKFADYDRKDAERARGHAERNRRKAQTPQQQTLQKEDPLDGIPF